MSCEFRTKQNVMDSASVDISGRLFPPRKQTIIVKQSKQSKQTISSKQASKAKQSKHRDSSPTSQNKKSLTRELYLEKLPPFRTKQHAMESISLALLMTRSPFGDLKPASAVGRKAWSKWAPATHLWEPLDPAIAQLASRACTRTHS